MFDKLKKLKEIKELKEKLAKEKIEVEEKGIKVVLNGKMEIEEIVLNQELPKEEQEKILKNCLNKGVKEIQLKIAQSISFF